MANILVVDDDIQIRSLLEKGFSQEGHMVVPVPELEQALVKFGQEEFDLVILDLQMRGEQGASFLKKIRDAKSDVPIVIYSGHVAGNVEQELRRAGANEVIGKEFGVNELLERVTKILKIGKRLFQESIGEKTLLIVEDDESIRNMLTLFFSNKKYKVLDVDTAEKALAIAESEKISCVLLDINLPGMSGLEALPKLLASNPDVGIVMISGEGDEGTVKEAMALGAYGYVMKPFDFVYLELTVASRLAIAAG